MGGGEGELEKKILISCLHFEELCNFQRYELSFNSKYAQLPAPPQSTTYAGKLYETYMTR